MVDAFFSDNPGAKGEGEVLPLVPKSAEIVAVRPLTPLSDDEGSIADEQLGAAGRSFGFALKIDGERIALQQDFEKSGGAGRIGGQRDRFPLKLLPGVF